MLNIGDTFIQNGLMYVVKGKDGAGRPVSSCKPEDIAKYKKAEEGTQVELPFVDVPNPTAKDKQSSKKAK